MKVWDSRKILAISILAFALTLAVQGSETKNAAAVSDVVLNSSGQSLEARITASGVAKFTYFELASPHRLVVDFHDSQNNVGFKEKLVEIAGVERIRTSSFSAPDRKATRIVFDLAGTVNYKVVDD